MGYAGVMTLFESLLVVLLVAVLLLQVSRRIAIPYPAMLAAAGALVAVVPQAPAIALDGETALALFVAPVLLDAAYDFPTDAGRRLWRPLVVLAILAVLATAGAVAWIGWAVAGLPWAAAVTLGAIVAPPDAAAATAVIGAVSVPRSTEVVLKGESLFNDATALLLFGGALAIQSQGGLTTDVGLRLALAAPGGLLLGVVLAMAAARVNRWVTGTLGGNILQFVMVYLGWVAAQRLQLSPVLCIVAFAMTLARGGAGRGAPRMRVHSYAVWATVVFLLNVLAFLLMGMQARTIVGQMPRAGLRPALEFAGLVIAAVIVARFAVILTFNRLAAWFRPFRGRADRPSLQQGVLVGWCGMRGLVTLATAFALPASFPQRDLVVLTAFAVVLATLVLQGMTLAPVIRLLRLDRSEDAARERTRARGGLADAALVLLAGREGGEADHLRYGYELARSAAAGSDAAGASERHRTLGLAAVAAERTRLEQLRADDRIGGGAYDALLEELDWRELTLLPDEHRRIVES